MVSDPEDINMDGYTAYVNLGGRGIVQGVHWYCKGCDRGVAKVLKALSVL